MNENGILHPYPLNTKDLSYLKPDAQYTYTICTWIPCLLFHSGYVMHIGDFLCMNTTIEVNNYIAVQHAIFPNVKATLNGSSA